MDRCAGVRRRPEGHEPSVAGGKIRVVLGTGSDREARYACLRVRGIEDVAEQVVEVPALAGLEY